jgi:hypothetical protein
MHKSRNPKRRYRTKPILAPNARKETLCSSVLAQVPAFHPTVSRGPRISNRTALGTRRSCCPNCFVVNCLEAFFSRVMSSVTERGALSGYSVGHVRIFGIAMTYSSWPSVGQALGLSTKGNAGGGRLTMVLFSIPATRIAGATKENKRRLESRRCRLRVRATGSPVGRETTDHKMRWSVPLISRRRRGRCASGIGRGRVGLGTRLGLRLFRRGRLRCGRCLSPDSPRTWNNPRACGACWR